MIFLYTSHYNLVLFTPLCSPHASSPPLAGPSYSPIAPPAFIVCIYLITFPFSSLLALQTSSSSPINPLYTFMLCIICISCLSNAYCKFQTILFTLTISHTCAVCLDRTLGFTLTSPDPLKVSFSHCNVLFVCLALVFGTHLVQLLRPVRVVMGVMG